MRLSGLRVLVAGAGAVGSVIALTLRRQGASVVLADPDLAEANASMVAAGMLAPALEAALDPAAAAHFALLRAARDLWPDLATTVAGELDRSGALWVGPKASQALIRDRLLALGATAESLSSTAAEAMAEGLKAPAGAILTSEDWRLDPRSMLIRLEKSFRDLGGERRSALLASFDGSVATFENGDRLAVDVVVLATGLAPVGLQAGPPELRWLEPIKGQILRLTGFGPKTGPSVRAEGIYLTPSPGGAVAGATMEPGRNDRHVDQAAVQRLQALASTLFPALAAGSAAGSAGIRSATPDGLPMVGPSSQPGVFLALGARRNGWLLAPMMAQILCDQLAGAARGPWTDLLKPSRFGVSPPG